MSENGKSPNLVGSFIRQRREALKLSQRALGSAFMPQVTTQFVSNLERGVTPLPPPHIPVLAKMLQIEEAELAAMLQKEYAAKLSYRLGKTENGSVEGDAAPETVFLPVRRELHSFMKKLYEALQSASPDSQEAVKASCESLLKTLLRD